jgi:cytochrome c553
MVELRASRIATLLRAPSWLGCRSEGAAHKFALRSLLAALLVMGAQCGPALPASLAERMVACVACHGENGQSRSPEVPSLGAQTAPYLLIQIFLFRERLRKVAIMNEAVASFSDDDLRSFADALAKLPPPVPDPDRDATRLERARTPISKYRCAFCHGADLAGRDNVPRIAGQREDYLVKTLREYKSSTRSGYDASMAEVLQPVSDAEIMDLAYYAARQP